MSRSASSASCSPRSFSPTSATTSRSVSTRAAGSSSESGLATFVTGSTSIGLGVLPTWAVIVLLAVGAALLVGYFLHSRVAERPILDLRLFRFTTFRASITGGLLFRIGTGAIPFLLPLMLQLAFGMTPFESGVVTFVVAIGAIVMKFLSVQILRRFGFKTVLIATALITGLFTAAPAAFTVATPVVVMLGVLLVGGFFRSLQFTGLNSIAYDEIPTDRISRASALSSVVQQLGMSLGISVAAMTLTATSGGGVDIVRGDFVIPFLLTGRNLRALRYRLLASAVCSRRRNLRPPPRRHRRGRNHRGSATALTAETLRQQIELDRVGPASLRFDMRYSVEAPLQIG